MALIEQQPGIFMDDGGPRSVVTDWLEAHLDAWRERHPGQKDPIIFGPLRQIAAQADRAERWGDEHRAAFQCVEDVVHTSVDADKIDDPDFHFWETPLDRLDGDAWVKWWLDALDFQQQHAPADHPIQRFTHDDMLAELEADLLTWHKCETNDARVLRMVLAEVSCDRHAYGLVRDELDDCPECLGEALNVAVQLHSADFVRQAGSLEEAENLAAAMVAKVLTAKESK